MRARLREGRRRSRRPSRQGSATDPAAVPVPRAPSRAVRRPSRARCPPTGGEHLVVIDAERIDDLTEVLLLDVPAATGGRGRERQQPAACLCLRDPRRRGSRPPGCQDKGVGEKTSIWANWRWRRMPVALRSVGAGGRSDRVRGREYIGDEVFGVFCTCGQADQAQWDPGRGDVLFAEHPAPQPCLALPRSPVT
jgi:hypothetical protein